MNKRNILFAIAMLTALATAMAQEVVTVHMKDGTTRSFRSNSRQTTVIDLWSYQPDTTHFENTTVHDNGYKSTWEVNGIMHANKQYAVLIYWTDLLPTAFEAEYGVCFGTKPGLTIDNCDASTVYTPENNTWKNSFSRLSSYERYIVIGPGLLSSEVSVNVPDVSEVEAFNKWGEAYEKPTSFKLQDGDTVCNFIKQQLEYGQTYFYRTFAKATYAEGSNPVYFYGTEHSFRVPNVMGDNGYYSRPVPTAEAMEEFGQLFPEGTLIPAWENFEPLWNLWRATDEGSAIDLTADITTKQFDDGTGYRLHRVPTEFYTWLTKREIKIDPIEGEFEISKIATNYGDSIVTLAYEPVTNVDATWGVPGNRYMKFVPTELSYVHHSATYSCHELVPGTKYQLQVFFAPETVLEPTDENSFDFRPTKVRITLYYTENGKSMSKQAVSSYEVPTTAVTTFVFDECQSEIDLRVKVQNRVSSSEFVRTHNRTFRIAGMKLTPLTEQSE